LIFIFTATLFKIDQSKTNDQISQSEMILGQCTFITDQSKIKFITAINSQKTTTILVDSLSLTAT